MHSDAHTIVYACKFNSRWFGIGAFAVVFVFQLESCQSTKCFQTMQVVHCGMLLVVVVVKGLFTQVCTANRVTVLATVARRKMADAAARRKDLKDGRLTAEKSDLPPEEQHFEEE